MPSATYQLFEQAMRAKSQIAYMYGGHPREVCPIMLGHSGGEGADLPSRRLKQFWFAAAGRVALPLPREGQFCAFA